MKKQTWRQWVRLVEKDPNTPSRLRKGSLGALTGQDARAMDVFVAALELYANSDGNGERAGLEAMRAALGGMQESVRWIAKELIPFILDWHYRESLWPKIVGGIIPCATTMSQVWEPPLG